MAKKEKYKKIFMIIHNIILTQKSPDKRGFQVYWQKK